VDDVNQFMENLEATGAFSNLLSRQERMNEDEQIESVLETVYSPRPAEGQVRPVATATTTQSPPREDPR
jgi:hypothetical protein